MKNCRFVTTKTSNRKIQLAKRIVDVHISETINRQLYKRPLLLSKGLFQFTFKKINSSTGQLLFYNIPDEFGRYFWHPLIYPELPGTLPGLPANRKLA